MIRYNPKMIERLSNKEIRELYSRARSIANKRIKRLNEAGLNMGKQLYPTLKELDTMKNPSSHIAAMLASASKFISTKQTTVRMMRKRIKQQQERLKERGYTVFDSPKKVLEFWEFMNALREKYKDTQYSSGDVMDVFEQGERLNIPQEKLVEHFDIWRDNLEKMEKLRVPRNGKEFSSDRIRRTIKKWSKE